MLQLLRWGMAAELSAEPSLRVAELFVGAGEERLNGEEFFMPLSGLRLNFG